MNIIKQILNEEYNQKLEADMVEYLVKYGYVGLTELDLVNNDIYKIFGLKPFEKHINLVKKAMETAFDKLNKNIPELVKADLIYTKITAFGESYKNFLPFIYLERRNVNTLGAIFLGATDAQFVLFDYPQAISKNLYIRGIGINSLPVRKHQHQIKTPYPFTSKNIDFWLENKFKPALIGVIKKNDNTI